jgi:hypothetical protein
MVGSFVNINKKVWGKRIAYFPLIGHGPHRKHKLGGIHRETDSRVIL